MADEQHDRAPDDAPPSTYCAAIPQVGDRLTDACADCGHATAVHIGVDHCPVCELVAHNATAQATAEAAAPQTLAERAWADVQARHEEARQAALTADAP